MLMISTAHADIYHCNIDGRTVLRDVPCPGTVKAATPEPPAPAQPATAIRAAAPNLSPRAAPVTPAPSNTAASAPPATSQAPMSREQRAARIAQLQAIIASGSVRMPQPQALPGASADEVAAANLRAQESESQYAASLARVQAAQRELMRLQREQQSEAIRQRQEQAGDLKEMIASLEADRRTQMYSRGCFPGRRQDAAATSAVQQQQLEEDDQRGDYERRRHGPPSAQEMAECKAINAEASEQIDRLNKRLGQTLMTSKGPVIQQRD